MSQLFIVATPIGNLSDITLRAIDTLKAVDYIAAEDTRHSKRLLSHFDIQTPCFSLHEHNENARIKKIITLLSQGKCIALISDAGTPLISDPGFTIVCSVREAGFSVVPIPGACAAIAALSVSGLSTARFVFEGFLPVKQGTLESRLHSLKKETRTIIFYESVHRIVRTLSVLKDIIGEERVVTVARELTKTFETVYQNTLRHVCDWMAEHPEQERGEFVIVLSGAEETAIDAQDAQLDAVLLALLDQLSVKQSVNLACKITGLSRKIAYERALQLRNDE